MIFITNFPFLADSLPPPQHHPFTIQNPLSVTKVFLSVLPNLSWFFKIIMLWWRLEELEQQSSTNTSIQVQFGCFHISPWMEVTQKRLFMVGILL